MVNLMVNLTVGLMVKLMANSILYLMGVGWDGAKKGDVNVLEEKDDFHKEWPNMIRKMVNINHFQFSGGLLR